MSTIQEEKVEVECYHCGNICDEVRIEEEEKSFCCDGCHMVYKILDANGLCSYYDIESNPGIKLVQPKSSVKFEFLDHEEVESDLLEFNEEDIAKVKFYVPSIHCSSCIWLLEKLHNLKDGIIQSQVNFLKKETYITFKKSEISLRQVVELMVSVGYEPVISLNSAEEKYSKSGPNKKLLIKLGVAGFTFGNIMLLSFPEYLTGQEMLDAQYKTLFGYLNLILALPVLLYSSTEYFISAYKALRKRFISIDLPISIGIVALFGRSTYEIITGYGAGFMDSFAMLVFLLLVGKWYQNYTYQALSFDRDYKSYFPIAVTKISGVKEESIPLKAVQVNDELLIRNGEIIPADSILLSKDAKIDYSFVSGESEPVSKSFGEELFAGGRQVGTPIRVNIKKEVNQSYLTRLWNQDAFAKAPSPMNMVINKVSQRFTIAVLSIAVLTLSYWLLQDNIELAIDAFTAVLIIACPCALALAIPFTFGNMMRLFGKEQLYLKNTDAIENMAKIDAIVFDKTGTITQNGNTLIQWFGDTLSQEQHALILAGVKNSMHPLSKMLAEYLKESDSFLELESFEEHTNSGIEFNVKTHQLKVGSLKWLGATVENQAVLTSRVGVSIDEEFMGYFAIKKSYRKRISEVLNELKGLYKIYLLSGDNDGEKNVLSKFFRIANSMHFNQSPEDKLDFVQNMQMNNEKVLMVGDGLNDAGALKQADIGLAVSDDVYSFSPACDGIINGSRWEDLPTFLKLSRKSLKIVYFSFAISIAYNLVGMYFAIQGLVTPLFAAVLMPLSSITVVSFTTIASRLIFSKYLSSKG